MVARSTLWRSRCELLPCTAGASFRSSSVASLENAGMDTTTAFDVNLVLQAFSIIGVAM
jgi:hypothetical protein